MPILPTHRDGSPSSNSNVPGSESSESTHVSRTPTIQNGSAAQNGEKQITSDVGNNEKRRSDYDDASEDGKGYDDKGVVEVEEDGVKRKVRVVLEHKSGKELLKEVAGGEYTTPRW